MRDRSERPVTLESHKKPLCFIWYVRNKSLRVRYEAGRNSGGTEERLEETTDDLPLDVKEAISAAILRIGKSAASPDPWLDAVDESVSGPAHVARQQ
ncbi:hypothetical protein JCM3774_001462 [Rhodotorula dairenensis]